MTLPVNALCTLADLKTELGISGNSEDSRLERLINASTNAIEKYCGRPEGFHYEAARVDYMEGFGTPLMHLVKTPVLSIASVVFDPTGDNETITGTLYKIDSAEMGRIYREDGWLWTVAQQNYLVNTPLPGTEQRLYKVTYACGYVTAAQVAIGPPVLTRSLPYDLEDACLQIAAIRYKWAPSDPTIKAERMLSWMANYGDRKGGGLLPSAVMEVLDTYRKVVFA